MADKKPIITIFVEKDGEDMAVTVEYDCNPEEALIGLMGAAQHVANGMDRDVLEILALIAHEAVRQKAIAANEK